MSGCKLLYIIQVKGFTWPYLISKILVAYNYSYNAAYDWPCTFLQPGCFCSYKLRTSGYTEPMVELARKLDLLQSLTISMKVLSSSITN